MHKTHNHFNLIPAEEREVAPGEKEEEDIDVQLPGLDMEEESSDKETYVDEEIEDIELIHNDSKGPNDKGNKGNLTDQSEQLHETRSGRRVKPPEWYRDTFI